MDASQQLPAAVSHPVGLGVPDPNGFIWGALSSGTGSILLDAAIGATAGSYLATSGKSRPGWMAAGAAATGLAGVLGLGGLIAYRLWRK
jgi:hypothetical protein